MTPKRLCRQCGYLLKGLSEHRCPECGQAFDPSDPRTYRVSREPFPWKGAALVTALATVAGAALWLASPMIFGTKEPWDGLWLIYLPLLILIGLLAAIACPRAFPFAGIGIVVGQWIGLCMLPGKWDFVPVGLCIAIPISLPALGGAALTFLIWRAVTSSR